MARHEGSGDLWRALEAGKSRGVAIATAYVAAQRGQQTPVACTAFYGQKAAETRLRAQAARAGFQRGTRVRQTRIATGRRHLRRAGERARARAVGAVVDGMATSGIPLGSWEIQRPWQIVALILFSIVDSYLGTLMMEALVPAGLGAIVAGLIFAAAVAVLADALGQHLQLHSGRPPAVVYAALLGLGALVGAFLRAQYVADPGHPAAFLADMGAFLLLLVLVMGAMVVISLHAEPPHEAWARALAARDHGLTVEARAVAAACEGHRHVYHMECEAYRAGFRAVCAAEGVSVPPEIDHVPDLPSAVTAEDLWPEEGTGAARPYGPDGFRRNGIHRPASVGRADQGGE